MNCDRALEDTSCRQDFYIDDYAIVFAGGGARGAWQIGFLKELIEQKVLRGQAEIVAGTSVGALNAVLYAQNPDDMTEAESVWKAVWNDENIKVQAKIEECSAYYYLFTGWKSIYLYSNDGLEKLIDLGLKKEFQMETIVCAYNKTEKIAAEKELMSQKKEIQKQWLLASTAIPFIFPSVKIGDNIYSDGGFGWDLPLREKTKMLTAMNNAPVELIIKKKGPKKILLLALSQIESTFLLNAPDDIVIYPVLPSEDLGNPLDFGRKHIEKLIALGQADCREWLEIRRSHSADKLYIHRKNGDILEKLQEKIDAADKFLNEIIDFKGDRSVAKREDAGFWYFLKTLEDIHKRKTDFSVAVEHILEDRSLADLPEKMTTEEVKEKLIKSLEDYSRRDARIKSLVDSIKSHEEGIEQISFRDRLLNNKQIKDILAELPDERHQCILDICCQLDSVMECLNKLQSDVADNRREILKIRVREIAKEIEKFFPETDDPPLKGLDKDFKSHILDDDFIGRRKELDELKENIDRNPGKTILLHGYFGNGKRTVARKFAEKYKGNYPGGILYITDAFQETAADAILNKLQGHENKLPTNRESAIELIEKKLTKIPGKKLIILEGVENTWRFFDRPTAQEELKLWDLLHDPEHFSVIATTTDSMADNDHCYPQQIGPLSEEEGARMLDGTFSHQEIPAIVRKVGGNPWALDFIRKRYKKEKQCVFEDYSEQEQEDFKSKKMPEEVMKRFLNDYVTPAFEKLPDNFRDMLIYASLLAPGDICRKWLVDFTGDKNALTALHRKAWLGRIVENRDLPNKQIWFTMLDNTREALRQIVDDSKLCEYGEKLCGFIIDKEWQDHIFSLKETEALAKIFLKWAESPWKKHILPILCSLSLEDDLGDYLTEYGLYTLRSKVCEAAKKTVEALSDGDQKQKYRASLKIYEGHIDLDEGKTDAALKLYQEAYEIRRNIKDFGPDAPETLLPLSYIATALGKNKQFAEAEDRFNSCIQECESRRRMLDQASGSGEKTTLFETMARLYKRYADFLHDKGDYEKAEVNYRLACTYAIRGARLSGTNTPRPLWLGNMYFHLGQFYKDTDEPEQAVKALKKSLSYLKSACSEQYPHPNIRRIDEILKSINKS